MINANLGLLVGFGVFLTLLVGTIYWGREVGVEELLAASRDVGFGSGTASLLATWTAPTAILVSAQVAYQRGIAGIFWFTVPNGLALILFGMVAMRIKERLPNGYTISELFESNSRKLYAVATTFTFLKSFLTLASAVVGGAAFLTYFSELSQVTAIAVLLTTLLAYSVISGLGASILTDVVQILVLGVLIAVFVPWTVASADGVTLVADTYSSSGLADVVSPSSLYFGISISVTLLTAPFISQFIWQRVYAIRTEDLERSFVATGLLFFFIPLSLSVLGLIAAAQTGPVAVENPLLAGYVVMEQFLPVSAATVAFLILIAALLSTGDSALVACSSILTVDVLDHLLDAEYDEERTFRVAMVLVAVIIGSSALLPISFLDWVLFNAPIGVVMTVPVLFVLYTSRSLSSRVMFYAIAIASVLSFPIYVYGSLNGENVLRFAALVLGFVVVTVPIALDATGYISGPDRDRIVTTGVDIDD